MAESARELKKELGTMKDMFNSEQLAFLKQYKYKMNLMTEIAAKEEFSGLDVVSELLKDKDIETNEQGRQLLEQYGYWGNNGNTFYSQFRHQVMVTGVVSTLICVLLLTFLLYWKKKEGACHQKILDQLEEILIRFHENKFDDLLKTENHAELEKEVYKRQAFRKN